MLEFIVWNIPPQIVAIGSWELRWYSLLFALGFILGGQILSWIYRQEGKDEKDVETLTLYMVPATVLGARLGHCLFYDPSYYLSNPIEILKVWEGGLASHGATIGILLAIYLYSKTKENQSYLYVLDRLVITIALAGCLIRLGNLMNSEIYGKPTNSSLGFVFLNGAQRSLEHRFGEDFMQIKLNDTRQDTLIGEHKYALIQFSMVSQSTGIPFHRLKEYVEDRVQRALVNTSDDDIADNLMLATPEFKYSLKRDENGNGLLKISLLGIARYPTQIMESLFALILFLLLGWIYLRKKSQTPEGLIFGLFVLLLFGFRFFIEYLKAPQVDFENNMSLNMGQWLSIPMILVGIMVLLRTYLLNSKKLNE